MRNNTRRSPRLELALALGLAGTQTMLAADFTLQIGSPVAAGNFLAKTAAIAVRAKDCVDPAEARLTGTAEGLVNGERRTVQLKHISAMPTPGVFTVNREWPGEGTWVVNLLGSCGSASAGALVPIGPKGFLRESSKLFPRPAADEEIEAAVKALGEAVRQQPESKD